MICLFIESFIWLHHHRPVEVCDWMDWTVAKQHKHFPAH